MNSVIATESIKRTERRFSVPESESNRILEFLRANGTLVRHGAKDSSSIVSFYYECDKIKADNNASIRQRTYLINGIDELPHLPCIVDAKVEISVVTQIKWRRKFDNWREAQRQLCAPPSLRPTDFFPELDRHYGGIGILSTEYGVGYDRLYFSLPQGISVTLDMNIFVLSIGSTGESRVISKLSEGTLEIKGLTHDCRPRGPASFAASLDSMGLAPATPKRAKARMLISKFKDVSRSMHERPAFHGASK